MIILYKNLYSISPKSYENIPTTGVFVLLFGSVGVFWVFINIVLYNKSLALGPPRLFYISYIPFFSAFTYDRIS